MFAPTCHEARRVAKQLRDDAQALVVQAEAWDRLVSVLEGIVPGEGERPTDGVSDEQPRDERTQSSVSAVVEVLNDLGRPAKIGEVHSALSPVFSRKTVGWALWKAAHDQLAKSLPGRGLYAPLNYEDPPPTDYAVAGRLGFAVPERLSADEEEEP